MSDVCACSLWLNAGADDDTDGESPSGLPSSGAASSGDDETSSDVTPTSPKSMSSSARAGATGAGARPPQIGMSCGEGAGDASCRSPSPDSPAPFSYTAPEHGGRNAYAATGGNDTGAGAPAGLLGTPELSPKSAAMEDVSSLAALVAAASPPSERGTLKRYAL